MTKMINSNTDSSGSLRTEAGPQTLDRLTKSQQGAVAGLVERLNVTFREIEDPARKDSTREEFSSEGFSSIDRSRKTRLLFWSGEPGIGKTSAFLSVRDWYENPKHNSRIDYKRLNADNPKLASALEEVRNGGNSNRIRWLEPLDLEPLSGRPNFLAAVAVRIDRALNRQTGGDHDAWLQVGSSEFRKIEQEFLQLKNNIALSWEGNLPDHGGALDPEVYAAEVLRAETARLNVNLEFRTIVSRLAKHAPGRADKRDVVFVLPIDDFYLKPDMTIELLRLLRMISCPHLFVLMMGDIDHVHELAFCHGLGEVGRLMDAGTRMLTEKMKSRTLRRTDMLASATLHKLIPVGQQFVLLSMEYREALDYRPREADPLLPSLGKLLIDSGLGKIINIEEKDGSIDTELWFVQDALELSPRHASDLYRALDVFIDERKNTKENGASPDETARDAQRRVQLVADQLERTLFESLESDVADRVWRETRDDFNYNLRKFPESIVDVDKVTDSEQARYRQIAESERDEQGGSVRRGRLFDMRLKKVTDDTKIPPRVRGWLAILQDTLIQYNTRIHVSAMSDRIFAKLEGATSFVQYAMSIPGDATKAGVESAVEPSREVIQAPVGATEKH
jgi:hypothetical protein